MKQKFLVRPALALFMMMALLILFAAPPPQVHAATITVTTATDELNGGTTNGFCSLREAIRNANLDTNAQADCPAGSGADIIIFNSSLDGVPITLSLVGSEDNTATGDLDIRSPITFTGNGATQTIIDGGAIDRVFDIPVAAATAVTFENLTVRNGSVGAFPGGGIRNNSTGPVTVTFNNGRITNNTTASSGGAISNTAANTVNLNNSSVDNNTSTGTAAAIGGGGIHNAGTLNITASAINSNSTIGGSGGGGIYNSGTLVINTSTINNNNTTGTFSSGGGLGISGGSTTLTNVTISGNRANGDGGGIQFIVSGSLTLNNVTITANIADFENVNGENGGGFAQSGVAASSTFNNVILAGNEDVSGTTQDDCTLGGTTTITSNGYNLRYAGGGCAARLNNANDITTTPATLGVGPLQNNGGSTDTHALLTGSDAIDRVPAAVNGCTVSPLIDQRGVTRADGIATGTLCDVGAFEYVGPAAPSAVNGGNGPGGIGTADGNSSLELWLRSDRGAFSNTGCSIAATSSGNVGCWQDQSGNGNNATESGTASPTYNTAVQNGQPSMRFDGVDDGFNLNPTLLPNGSSARTFVFATQANAGAAFQSTLSYGTNAAGQRINVTTTAAETAVAVQLHTYGITSGTTNWQTAVIDIPSTSTSDGWDFYRDSVQLAPEGTIAGSPQTINTGTADADLGRASFIASFYDGDIGEAIVYSVELPSVQRILVDNYLSAKYDVSLGANDVYDGDTGANGNFDLDVAGIGRFGGNNHTQAYSVGMIVRNRSFLQDDGDWLLFGHRTAVNSNSTNDLPTTGDWATAPDPRRWDRHWYVDVTDVVGTTGGTVDIIFDFSEGSMDGQLPNVPVSNYRLLKRTLDTGQFSDIATATAVVGDQVQFLNVNVADLGSNFTLGTLDFTDSPTAVTMQNLTATHNNMPIILIMGVVLVLLLGSAGVLMRRRVGVGISEK